MASVTFADSTCAQVYEQLRKLDFQWIEVLSLPRLRVAGIEDQFSPERILEVERLFMRFLAQMQGLRVLKITESDSFSGTYVHVLRVQSLILDRCKNIVKLVLPETVKHLDVAECDALKEVWPCRNVWLIRAERFVPIGPHELKKENLPIVFHDFNGRFYSYEDVDKTDLISLRQFLQRGVNVDMPIPYRIDGVTSYKTLLHTAVFESADKVSLLVSKGADIEARNGKGNTPLSCAAMYGLDREVALLLGYGANPRVVNVVGETPQQLAKGGSAHLLRRALNLSRI